MKLKLKVAVLVENDVELCIVCKNGRILDEKLLILDEVAFENVSQCCLKMMWNCAIELL